MTEEIKVHETILSWVKAPPAELDAGSDMVLKVKAMCSLDCDLQGNLVTILDQDAAVVTEIELVSSGEALNETDEFTVTAPIPPGEYTWTAVLSAPHDRDESHAEERKEPQANDQSPAEESEKPREGQGVLHAAIPVPFTFIVKPHATSMSVWDVPTPTAVSAEFKIKVGVLCAAGCKLSGTPVDIYDDHENKVATGTLSEEPWSAAGPLYWVEIALQAPATQGYYEWSARFPKPNLEQAHEASTFSFAFATADPPDHVVTVEVIDRDQRTLVPNAYVTIHADSGFPYRSRTDENGRARISVPKGKYNLYVVLNDYKDLKTTTEVDGDATIQLELQYHPDLGG